MIFKKIMHYLFGWQYVLLVDFDGEENVVRARKSVKQWYAYRWPYGLHRVVLLPNGRLKNGSYVKGWEPLTDGIVFEERHYGAD